MPSFDAEYAVYIVASEQGTSQVVGRKLNEHLYGLMMFQIEIQAGGAAVGKTISLGPAEQTAALAKIRASTDTEHAEIDQATVKVWAAPASPCKARY